jgi:hypothetical protein
MGKNLGFRRELTVVILLDIFGSKICYLVGFTWQKPQNCAASALNIFHRAGMYLFNLDFRC